MMVIMMKVMILTMVLPLVFASCLGDIRILDIPKIKLSLLWGVAHSLR